MMLTVLRLARCSVVTRGWLARKATRGGARERVVGRWVASSCRNTAGSNLGTGVTRVTASSCSYLGRVTARPPWCSMPDIVTFSPKMWYRGSTHTVTSSCTWRLIITIQSK